MLCIVSTVGSSIFEKNGEAIKKDRDSFKKSTTQTDIRDITTRNSGFPGEDIYWATIRALEAKIENIAHLRDASAEINSLESIIRDSGVNSGHDLHFLGSATPEGALAARILKDFCAKHYQSQATCHIVTGLQVRDAKQFRHEALPELVRIVYEVLDSAKTQGYKAVINPTAGFKVMGAYLTLIGMLRGKQQEIQISYLYEGSEELISLAGLPINLDYERMNSIYDALAECEAAQTSGLPEIELQKLLKLKNQRIESHEFWSLFELFESNHYMLSGLGKIVFRELTTIRAKIPVYLSRQATTIFDKLDGGSGAKRNYVDIF